MRVLVTGATGFVGRAVLPKLTQAGHQVRILLRPSPASPRLPTGVPVEVGLSSLTDERGLRADLLEVEAILHLAGGEGRGSRADLVLSDAEATRTLVEAASQGGVRRILFLSHLGADRVFGLSGAPGQGLGRRCHPSRGRAVYDRSIGRGLRPGGPLYYLAGDDPGAFAGLVLPAVRRDDAAAAVVDRRPGDGAGLGPRRGGPGRPDV